MLLYPVLIILCVLASWFGFRDGSLFDRFSFSIGGILQDKQYYRLVTSGFLHVGWPHLILNMLSIYLFSQVLEGFMGSVLFMVVYMAGLIGGNLLALFIHRHHPDYTAVGASGAACGLTFAFIALFPGSSINLLFIPIGIPGWLYGLAYILYSIYGIRSQSDNIGHEAHLGGALVGMFTALAFYPQAFAQNLFVISIISVPALFYMYIIITRPHVLLVDNFYFNHHGSTSIDDRYNLDRAARQREVDALLDKINRRGIDSLTKAEKDKLADHSRNS